MPNSNMLYSVNQMSQETWWSVGEIRNNCSSWAQGMVLAAGGPVPSLDEEPPPGISFRRWPYSHHRHEKGPDPVTFASLKGRRGGCCSEEGCYLGCRRRTRRQVPSLGL